MDLTEYLSLCVKSVLILIITALALFYWFVSKDYGYWKKRGIKYKKPFLIFGNLEFLMRKSFWDFFYELGQKYPEPYVGVFLGHKPALVVQSPDLARRILVKDAQNFSDRFIYSGDADPIGALNLFNIKNPVWSELRRELSPIFTSAKLRTLTDLMNLNAKEVLNRIDREHVKKNVTVNMKDLFSRYTSDTVGYTVFGLRTSALKDDDNPLWYITTHMVKWTFRRGFEFTMTFFVPAVASLFRMKFFSEAATEYVRKIFKTVVEEREQTGSHNDQDLVSVLLKLKDNIEIPKDVGPEYADNLMLAQAAVFILGAVETSSTTITYCLHELAYNPDKQEKLYKEINEALIKSGKEMLNYDELLGVKYLNSCIQETLRKYVPVPHADRICQTNYIVDDKLTIEKGTPVYLNLVAIHHDKRNYEEPHKWIPERFTGVAADSDNRNYTYLPFGEGPRFCIGKRYGMIQTRAAIAQVIHKYRVEPGSPYALESDPYSIILGPKDGGVLKFVPRKAKD